MTRMRPLRAIAAAAGLAALYLALRMPALVAEFDALTRPAPTILAAAPMVLDLQPNRPAVPPVLEVGFAPPHPPPHHVAKAAPRADTAPAAPAPSAAVPVPFVAFAAAPVAAPSGAPAAPLPAAAGPSPPRRWSGEAYVFARAAGPTDFASAALLGGGQSGGSLAFTPRPDVRRPLALVLRGAVAHSDAGSAQVALGVRWRLLPGLSLSAERLFALGPDAVQGWTLRLAGGGQGHAHGLDWSAYGEAGIAGGTAFADGQAFLGAPLRRGALAVTLGAGVWGAAQADGALIDRLDAGPSIRLRHDRLPLSLSADWRFRLAGNAEPGSGPALTLYASF